MGATIVYGKSFKRVQVESTTGTVQFDEVIPVEGDYEHISYATLRELKVLAETHGIPQQCWPDYSELEMSAKVPLDEVKERNEELRLLLCTLSGEIVEKHDILRLIYRILNDGKEFFII